MENRQVMVYSTLTRLGSVGGPWLLALDGAEPSLFRFTASRLFRLSDAPAVVVVVAVVADEAVVPADDAA